MVLDRNDLETLFFSLANHDSDDYGQGISDCPIFKVDGTIPTCDFPSNPPCLEAIAIDPRSQHITGYLDSVFDVCFVEDSTVDARSDVIPRSLEIRFNYPVYAKTY